MSGELDDWGLCNGILTNADGLQVPIQDKVAIGLKTRLAVMLVLAMLWGQAKHDSKLRNMQRVCRSDREKGRK